jgi:signal transduction histidine kinase
VVASLLANAFAHGQPSGVVRVDFDARQLNVSNPSLALPEGVGEAFVKGPDSAGQGLGLSIVRRLLQRHGGELHIGHQDGRTRLSVSS